MLFIDQRTLLEREIEPTAEHELLFLIRPTQISNYRTRITMVLFRRDHWRIASSILFSPFSSSSTVGGLGSGKQQVVARLSSVKSCNCRRELQFSISVQTVRACHFLVNRLGSKSDKMRDRIPQPDRYFKPSERCFKMADKRSNWEESNCISSTSGRTWPKSLMARR